MLLYLRVRGLCGTSSRPAGDPTGPPLCTHDQTREGSRISRGEGGNKTPKGVSALCFVNIFPKKLVQGGDPFDPSLQAHIIISPSCGAEKNRANQRP